jgi:hypothetical protein
MLEPILHPWDGNDAAHGSAAGIFVYYIISPLDKSVLRAGSDHGGVEQDYW